MQRAGALIVMTWRVVRLAQAVLWKELGQDSTTSNFLAWLQLAWMWWIPRHMLVGGFGRLEVGFVWVEGWVGGCWTGADAGKGW